VIRSWSSTANVRAVLSTLATLALVGAAQIANAANIIRIGVDKIEFKWAAASGAPEGYLVSRSNKGGPLQAFAWVTQPRVEISVVPGDQVAISVRPGARNSAGALILGPASAQSDRVWITAAPTFPIGGNWLLRCSTCPSMQQRSVSNASRVLAEVSGPPTTWKPLGRAVVDGASEVMVWHEETTGRLIAWDPDDLVTVPGTLGTAGLAGALRGVGPADFDRDGIEELVVQRVDTGWVLLIGLTEQGLRLVAALPAPAGAELAAARDFTRDGKIDFVWRDYAAGKVTLQSVMIDPKLNPPAAQLYGSPKLIASQLTSNFAIASTGDYDGDNWLDLLWRHGTGQLQIMYLVKGQLDQVANLVFQTDDAGRFVVGSDDLDGIPGEEIALQHATNKEMALVFPAKPTTSQRMKWLHPGSEWRALRWDY
jgi:hypothetical protein